MNADEKGATYLRISDSILSSDNSIALDGDGQQSALSEKVVRIDPISGEAQLHNTNGISLSAFLKASHRLRSMSLVGGYLIQCRGRFKAFLETNQVVNDNFQNNPQVPTSSKRWYPLMTECELKVKFSTRRQKFVIEIHSLDLMEVQKDRLDQSNANQSSLNESQMIDNPH